MLKLLACLDKLTKGKNEPHDPTKQLLASWDTVKDSNELGDKTGQPQGHTNSLKVFKCPMKRICLVSTECKLCNVKPKPSLYGWLI